MLSHQRVALFKRIRRCGLVGRSILLGVGFGISEAHARPKVSLFPEPMGPVEDLSVTIPYHVYLSAAILPVNWCVYRPPLPLWLRRKEPLSIPTPIPPSPNCRPFINGFQ